MFMEHILYHEKWDQKFKEDLNTESNEYVSLRVLTFHLRITSMASIVLCLAERWMCARLRLRVICIFRNLIQICTLQSYS